MSLRKELRDQSAHLAVGMIGVLPVALWPHPLSMLWATFMMGLMREVGEEGSPVTFAKVRHALGSTRDLGAWTLAGLLAWAISRAVQ